MTKFSRLLALAGLAGTLLTGTAFAQSTSSGSMSSSDHMAHGNMSSMSNGHTASGSMMSHGHSQMSSGAMSGDHMKTKHMKAHHMKKDTHGKKKRHHMTSGAMTNGH
jgi:hypothetical protein